LSAEPTIRAAAPSDVTAIYDMIVGLAVYENEPEAVTGTVPMLHDSLFGAAPSCEALVAEIDGTVCGFALFHGTYSTWQCKPGLWLEDFYVEPELRRHGIGEKLFRGVARVAVERDCGRLAWTALDWNEPALAFYSKMGAEVLEEWTTHRLSADALRTVATG